MSTRRRFRAAAGCVAGLVLTLADERVSAQEAEAKEAQDVVAVGLVDGGRAIVLATPGLPHRGLRWRFRSLDTSELPQPIHDLVMAASGTKLFLQAGSGHGAVLDLTQQQRHNAPLQFVAPGDLAIGIDRPRHSHRLPRQRFVSIHDGTAYVIDDVGRVQLEYAPVPAIRGAIAGDGVALYLRPEGTLTICGEDEARRHICRDVPSRPDGTDVRLSARGISPRAGVSAPRFVVMMGGQDRSHVVDPEREGASAAPVPRTEAALQAALLLQGTAMSADRLTSLVNSLIEESANTLAGDGTSIADWRFFPVSPNEALYAPVLQFARAETVFPDAFESLDELARGAAGGKRLDVPRLYDRYLRLDRDERRQRCTVYFRMHSPPGSWIIEYWFYYPFDVGGLGSHAHDPEHLFVEVDKLGGAPRRVIGAGHGYMAGNNIYAAYRPGAHALRLPLFALVELGKHAMAPDVDRDGHFTPGVDENEYRERAKIWGVRDVIGTINNQLLAFDTTMSVVRRPQDALAITSANTSFPDEFDLPGELPCRLEPLVAEPSPRARALFRLSDWMILPPCHDLSATCAKQHVTLHPDFLDFRAVLKEWSFPESFLRAAYGFGPRRYMHSIGLGYAKDLDRVPLLGRIMPLPGRLGVEAFYWRQDVNHPDVDSCVADCERSAGAGWGLRYEQFLSNLFGIYSATRVYDPPLRDLWVTFGPFVEAPLGRRSNVGLQGGLSFRPYASPRFELRVSFGLWKPKTNYVGVRAASDDDR